MSGSKRARPLGYAEGAGSREPAAKVLKQDTAAIYEATLNKLKLGARVATTTGGGPGGSAYHSPGVVGKQHDFEGGSSSISRISDGVVGYCQTEQGLTPIASASHGSRVLGQQRNFEGGSSSSSNSNNGVVGYCQNEQGLVRVPSNSPWGIAMGVSRSSTHSLPTTTPRVDSRQPSPTGDPRPCYVCKSRAAGNMCFHCSRGCCEQCSRRCEGCQELFCSICSTSNYNERYDRIFCFDCNATTSNNHHILPIRSTCDDEARDMEYC